MFILQMNITHISILTHLRYQGTPQILCYLIDQPPTFTPNYTLTSVSIQYTFLIGLATIKIQPSRDSAQARLRIQRPREKLFLPQTLFQSIASLFAFEEKQKSSLSDSSYCFYTHYSGSTSSLHEDFRISEHKTCAANLQRSHGININLPRLKEPALSVSCVLYDGSWQSLSLKIQHQFYLTKFTFKTLFSRATTHQIAVANTSPCELHGTKPLGQHTHTTRILALEKSFKLPLHPSLPYYILLIRSQNHLLVLEGGWRRHGVTAGTASDIRASMRVSCQRWEGCNARSGAPAHRQHCMSFCGQIYCLPMILSFDGIVYWPILCDPKGLACMCLPASVRFERDESTHLGDHPNLSLSPHLIGRRGGTAIIIHAAAG